MNNRFKHLESINTDLGTEQLRIVKQLQKTNLTPEQAELFNQFIQLAGQKLDNAFEMMECVASQKAKVDKVLYELPLLIFHVPLSIAMPTKNK